MRKDTYCPEAQRLGLPFCLKKGCQYMCNIPMPINLHGNKIKNPVLSKI